MSTEIGLFPLPLVLLPGEHLPLHIFEPRYRELVGECLEQEEPFGLIYGQDVELHERGTAAHIVSVLERYEDGRLDIVVEGGDRFRVVEFTEGRSFLTARIDEVSDSDDAADQPETAQTELVDRVLAVYARLLALTGADLPAPARDEPGLSYAVAGRFELPADQKLELLDLDSEPARLKRVSELLEELTAELERRRELAAKAQKNGHHP